MGCHSSNSLMGALIAYTPLVSRWWLVQCPHTLVTQKATTVQPKLSGKVETPLQ